MRVALEKHAINRTGGAAKKKTTRMTLRSKEQKKERAKQ